MYKDKDSANHDFGIGPEKQHVRSLCLCGRLDSYPGKREVLIAPSLGLQVYAYYLLNYLHTTDFGLVGAPGNVNE